jgi:hypothetical protein
MIARFYIFCRSETVIVGPVPGAGDRARAFVDVGEAAGRTAEQAADEVVDVVAILRGCWRWPWMCV